MSKKRRAQIVALVIGKGGFGALSKRIGYSKEMLYAVIKWGTRRGQPELLVKLRDELGVDPMEWPKPVPRRVQSSAA